MLSPHAPGLALFFQYTLSATMVTMGAAFVYFIVQSAKVPDAYRSIINLSIIIVGVAAVMYAFMALHYNPMGPSFDQQGLTLFRYVDWTITTPLLVIKFPELLGVDRKETAMLLALADLEMIVAGFLGTLTTDSGTRLMWGAISMVGYLVIFYIILVPLRARAQQATSSIAVGYQRMLLFVLISWGVYPIVYLFPVFAASPTWEMWGQIASNVADIVNKVGVGIVTSAAIIAASRTPVETNSQHPELGCALILADLCQIAIYDVFIVEITCSSLFCPYRLTKHST